MMKPSSLFALFAFLFSSLAFAHDVCETKYTLLHYAEARCYDIARPLPGGETFTLHTAFITKSLAESDDKPTIVIIPGGPGESAEPLETELQKRELINGMWSYLGMNVILFDPRGTGMSPFPKSTQSYDGSVISTANMVEDLKAVLDTVSPHKPVFILAHSAGGAITLSFAERHPEYVKKILLVSTSASPRQMAEMNMGIYGIDSSFWTEALTHIPGDQAALTAKYHHVEDVLVQQLKARILGKYIHPTFQKLDPVDFREEILLRLEADPSGASVVQLVESYDRAFEVLDSQGPPLVPADLRTIRLTEDNLSKIRFSPKEWIQRQIMCGEGMLAEDIRRPIIYDGVTMHRFCGDIHASEAGVFEPSLSSIQTPIVFLSGEEDTQVPGYLARRIVEQLPHAQLITAPGTGHIFFDKKPMIFFNALEAMVKN